MTSPDTHRPDVSWADLFATRAAHDLPFSQVPLGRRDGEECVKRFLSWAAFFEQRGVEILLQKASEAHEPAATRCVLHHATEEQAHVRNLCQLAEIEKPEDPPVVLRWAERVVNRPRAFLDQSLVTLVVESLGMALYEMVAEALRPGRVSDVLAQMADDERTHLAFTSDLLASSLALCSRRDLRRLRRLRAVLVAAIVSGHAAGHRRVLQPVLLHSARETRSRFLREIERTLSGIPSLAVAPRA